MAGDDQGQNLRRSDVADNTATLSDLWTRRGSGLSSSAPITTLLTLGAGLATLIGLAIALWQVTNDLWCVAAYVACIWVCGLGVANSQMRKALAQAADKADRDESALEGLQNAVAEADQAAKVAQGLTGLAAYLTQEPTRDRRHHYSLVREEYIIDDDDDGTFSWLLEGTNVSDDASNELVLKITGDTAADLVTFQVAARDHSSDRALTVAILTDLPLIKVCAVQFAEPVRPGDAFAIKVTCRWPTAFLRDRIDDYVFLAWGYFALCGVDLLEGRIRSNGPIVSSRLERIGAEGVPIVEPGQPRHVIATSGRDELEWSLENPRSMYLVRFTKRRAR